MTLTAASRVRPNQAENMTMQKPDLFRGSQTVARGGGGRSTLARGLMLAGTSLGYAVVQLDVTIVNTALGSIGHSLHGGIAELQWVVAAYTIAFAALILTGGVLGDRFGVKKVFMAGFALFTAASLGCALAPSAMTLIVARAVQGGGAALLVPNSLALLNHAHPDERERGRVIGIWAAGGSVLGVALFGSLVGQADAFIPGMRDALVLSAMLLVGAAMATMIGANGNAENPQRLVHRVG
jgi:MFS transporter, DHA2 family, methylenomycin A resistance protein